MGIPATSTTKLTAAGNIKASAGYLLWFIVSNDKDDDQDCIFNNATSGTGSEVFRLKLGAYETICFAFPIALWFSTGIRVGTLDGDLTITCGYI